MTASPGSTIKEPRIETSGPLLLVGLEQQYPLAGNQNLPEQWQRFVPYIGAIQTAVPNTTYGVVYNFVPESHYDYLTAVEVENAAEVPEGLTKLTLPAQKYAKFTHADHVASIRSTFATIFGEWFPNSDLTPAEAPTIEYYGPNFNPATGTGGLEIWIPIQ